MKGDGSCPTGDALRALAKEMNSTVRLVVTSEMPELIEGLCLVGETDYVVLIFGPEWALPQMVGELRSLSYFDPVAAAMMTEEPNELDAWSCEPLLVWPDSAAFELQYDYVPPKPQPFWQQLNQSPKGPVPSDAGGKRNHQRGTSHRRQR